MKKLYSEVLRAMLLASFLGCASVALAQDSDTEDDVFTLSPFVVDASGDTGYRATSTWAGTRIRTDLKDLGSAISVYTSEFMEDLDSTDSETLLSFTTNTEVGGEQGNFSGIDGEGDGQDSRIFSNEARTDPQSATRIRGLGKAALTRDYFLRDFAYDAYNTERITISRGANSLLFGIGSPGGVINNATKRAIIGGDLNTVSVRIDDFGGFRTSADFNRTLVEDRLAIRVNALYDDKEYNQEQAFREDRRIHFALDGLVFKNENSQFLGETRISVNAEFGSQDGSPPQTTPPSVAYHNWFAPINSNITDFTGETPESRVIDPSQGGSWEFKATYNPFETGANENSIPTSTRSAIFRHLGAVYNGGTLVNQAGTGFDGVEGYLGLVIWNGSDTPTSAGLLDSSGNVLPGPAAAGLGPDDGLTQFRLFHSNSPYGAPYAVGFTVPTLQNREVFDYRNNVYSGDIDMATRDFYAKNVTLSQGLFDDKVNVNLAFDRQQYRTFQDYLFTGGNGTSQTGPYDIYIDIAEYSLNGLPNPNLGRPYTRVARPETISRTIDRETIRLQASSQLNFAEKDGWLRNFGNHTFTGLWNTHKRDNFSINTFDAWGSADPANHPVDQIVNGALLSHFRRPVNVLVYSGPSALNANSADDVRINPINIARPQPGDTFDILYANFGAFGIPGDRQLDVGPAEVVRYERTGGISRREIDSWAASWQGSFFDDNLIALYGIRNDHLNAYGRDGSLPITTGGILNRDSLVLSDDPNLSQAGDTETFSAVLRYPENWLGELPGGMDFQLHYSESENFDPVGARRDAFGQFLPQPQGNTKEYGFLWSFNEGRYTVKANWFESTVRDVSITTPFDIPRFIVQRINNYRGTEEDEVDFNELLEWDGVDRSNHPVQSYQDFYAAMEATIPQEIKDLGDFRLETDIAGSTRAVIDRIPDLAATQDRDAEGFEIELTADLTSNWRTQVNISQQETVNSNSAGANGRLLREVRAALDDSRLLELVFDYNNGGAQNSLLSRWIADGAARIASVAARDGTVAQEQREWRIAGLTRYLINEGRFNGVSIGGSFAWQDEAATGYVFRYNPDLGVAEPDVSRPFLDDGILSASLFLGYERTIGNDVDWSIRLNFRNLIGNSDDVVTRTNPDGLIAAIRNPNPSGISLTNTFRF